MAGQRKRYRTTLFDAQECECDARVEPNRWGPGHKLVLTVCEDCHIEKHEQTWEVGLAWTVAETVEKFQMVEVRANA